MDENRLIAFIKPALICGLVYYFLGPAGLAIAALILLIKYSKKRGDS